MEFSSLSFLYSSPYFAMFTKPTDPVALMKTDIGVLKKYAAELDKEQ